MNNRVLFFLSITIIAVGIAGIFFQRFQSPSDNPPVTPHATGARVITIAEASRELHPYEILQVDDYKIRTIEIDDTKEDVRDLSSFPSIDLKGYLVRDNIAQGAAIIPALIESPDSKTFILHSMRGNEFPYSYLVKPNEEYLLSSLKVGNKVSLFIRIVEVESERKSKASYVPEDGSSEGLLRKYTLSPVLGGLSILDVQQDKKSEEKSVSLDQDESIGKIVLRMNQEQLADLRVVEKVGEIILFPAEGGQEKNKKKGMDEVLPQFHAIKELRGGK